MAFYFNSFDRILADGLQARPGRRLAADRLHAVAQKARDLIGPYGWMRFFDSYLRTPSLRTGQLRMPFLIIGGDADIVAPPSDARALGQALPAAAVRILPGHGHFPMLTAGDSFAALANDFLRANRTRLRPAARPHREHIR
jgi:pimeloyl-ACP methyl ester carboxylesterase